MPLMYENEQFERESNPMETTESYQWNDKEEVQLEL